MFVRNNVRFFPHLPFTDDQGNQFGNLLAKDLQAKYGVTEVADPVRGDDRFYYNTEIDASPYLISTLKPLAQLQDVVCELIAAKAEEKRRAGVLVTWPDGTSSRVQTRDPQDLINVNGQATAALILQAQGVTTKALEYRDENNVTHSLTPTEMVSIGMAVSAGISAIYKAMWAKKDAVKALTDPATVVAYDIEAGWPI